MTKVEVAFALIAIDNNFNNWFYEAKMYKNEIKDGDVDILEGTSVPSVIYQGGIHVRKYNVHSAEKFTD